MEIKTKKETRDVECKHNNIRYSFGVQCGEDDSEIYIDKNCKDCGRWFKSSTIDDDKLYQPLLEQLYNLSK